MNPIEGLKSVLCDSEGRVCINGSEGDRRIISELLITLERQLEEARKQNVMLRDALKDVDLHCNASAHSKKFREALAATNDLSDCILCDAVPQAVVKGAPQGQIFKTIQFLVQAGGIPNGTKLYKARKT
jgi:hypothetical protein